MDYTIFQQLGVAFALSTIVGLEREHRYHKNGYHGFSGLRTNALIGLFGATVYSLFADQLVIFAVFTAGFLALITAAYIVTSRKPSEAGATSEMAAILVYLVGVLCGMQEYLVAVVLSLAILGISYFKRPLHLLAEKIQNHELVSTMQFMIITFVILPILPNKGFGIYEFFNPYLIWLMVVLVSGISFASYIAIKIWGARKGIVLTGFLAGFISTNALTYTLSTQSKKFLKVKLPFILGIVIAIAGLYFRVIFEVAVVHNEMLPKLLIPMLSMGIVGSLVTLSVFLKKEVVPKEVEQRAMKMKSPFTLGPAINFALIFAFVLFMTKFVVEVFGTDALYAASIFTGFLDMDSIVISNARLAVDGDITDTTAVIAITFAAISNTLSKSAIFFIFGNRVVAKKIFLYLSPVIGAALISLFFV